MKKVIKYESENGFLFDTSEEATKADVLFLLEKQYKEKELVNPYSDEAIEWETFLYWIKENCKYTQTLLNNIKAFP
jgi:hypothetical protein